MSDSKSIGVGVIGLGFMGQTHVNAYRSTTQAGYPCELRAMCDVSPERLTAELKPEGNLGLPTRSAATIDWHGLRRYESAQELLDDPDIQLVSICTYTDTHVDLAIAALNTGKHVLVEKPVAIRSEE